MHCVSIARENPMRWWHRVFVPMRQMILRTPLLAGVLLLALTACASRLPHSGAGQADSAHPISANNQPAGCMSAQLAFSLDADDGRFNGVSHGGTTLVLRNTGSIACTIPAQPVAAFSDAARRTLDIAARDPSGAQRASPETLTLAPGASATSDMRWVSSNVYPGGHCETPAFVTLHVGAQTATTTFTGHLCGAAGKPPSYTLTPFQRIGVPTQSTTTKTLTYGCDDGRTVHASYPDADTAVLTMDGQTYRLHTAISADGARYVGTHWQWWTKGMRQGRLAPLKPGETIASATGVSCTAP